VSDFGWWAEQAKEGVMKVVSKSGLNGPYTVLDESPKYYIVRDAVGRTIAVDKQGWEPVQEWTDETGLYDGTQAMEILACSNYRLVRHEVDNLHKEDKTYAYLLEKVKR
jgi:malonyl CoA-acyl carrier protein transacylase